MRQGCPSSQWKRLRTVVVEVTSWSAAASDLILLLGADYGPPPTALTNASGIDMKTRVSLKPLSLLLPSPFPRSGLLLLRYSLHILCRRLPRFFPLRFLGGWVKLPFHRLWFCVAKFSRSTTCATSAASASSAKAATDAPPVARGEPSASKFAVLASATRGGELSNDPISFVNKTQVSQGHTSYI